MSVSEMESYRDLILENIEYDHLCREFTTYREDLDEIVELMVETVCAKRKTTTPHKSTTICTQAAGKQPLFCYPKTPGERILP